MQAATVLRSVVYRPRDNGDLMLFVQIAFVQNAWVRLFKLKVDADFFCLGLKDELAKV